MHEAEEVLRGVHWQEKRILSSRVQKTFGLEGCREVGINLYDRTIAYECIHHLVVGQSKMYPKGYADG